MTGLLPAVRTLIVDDEPDARERIREILADEPAARVIGEAGDGPSAATAIQELKPDLVFLDIRMPEIDGFGVLATIEARPLPQVVFVTALDTHAIRAFEMHAVDYVLKPFDRERLLQAFSRARERIHLGEVAASASPLLRLLEDAASPRHMERVLVRTPSGFQLVRTTAIDWIEASGNYVTLHCDGRERLLRQTMTGLERQLDPALFRRIHRSTVVNLDRVREIVATESGEYDAVLLDGTRLRVGRQYRRGLLSETS